MERDVILKAENLTFFYDNEENLALDGLNLEIFRGERVAVMGANGSGKSTFFLCCNGVLRPGGGRLYLDGRPAAYDRKGLLELRRRVGIVFQDPDDQLFSASVDQEISFGPLNLGLPREQVRREVDEIVRRLEIEPFRDRPAHALSGGQKKQVAIADILVMHPEIIILDEPAAALDPRHTAIVDRIVEGLTAEGITVLMSTHDVDHAWRWADRVVIFHRGKVLVQGRPEQVFRQKELLARASLEPPAVLALYDSLVEKGLLPDGAEPPRDMGQLEGLLVTRLRKKE